MNRAELRRAVETNLQRRVPDPIWAYLIQHGYVSEALTEGEHADPVKWLANEARQLIDLETDHPAPLVMPPKRQRRLKAVPLRLEAISDLLAAEARKEEKVRTFREDFLEGRLLEPSEVEAWIERNRQRTTFDRAVVIRIPEGYDYQVTLGDREAVIFSADWIESETPRLTLPFATPDSNLVRRIPIGRDGVLRWLADLSELLATKFSWQPAQATIFVLTDYVPLLPPDQVAVQRPPFLALGSYGHRSVECLAKFVITLDPRTSPREVAQLYAKARQRTIVAKLRHVSEKHMLLASFVAQRGELSRDVMRLWNQEHPTRKYKRFALFSRDTRAAAERLLFGQAIDRQKVRLNLKKG